MCVWVMGGTRSGFIGVLLRVCERGPQRHAEQEADHPPSEHRKSPLWGGATLRVRIRRPKPELCVAQTKERGGRKMPVRAPLADASGGASRRAEDDVSDAAGTANGTIAMTAPGQQVQSAQSSGHSSSQGAPSSCPPASVSSAHGSALACPSLSSAWSSCAAPSHGHEMPQVLKAAAKADAPPRPSGPKNTDTASSQTAATRVALLMPRVFVMRSTYYTNHARQTHPRQRRSRPVRDGFVIQLKLQRFPRL